MKAPMERPNPPEPIYGRSEVADLAYESFCIAGLVHFWLGVDIWTPGVLTVRSSFTERELTQFKEWLLCDAKRKWQVREGEPARYFMLPVLGVVEEPAAIARAITIGGGQRATLCCRCGGPLVRKLRDTIHQTADGYVCSACWGLKPR